MEDTIAAVATAYGEGGIGIIRISGPGAERILSEVFVPASGNIEARKFTYGHIVDEDKTVDEVMAVIMHGPKTYTCEDVAEINCHGGIIPLKKTLELVLSKGARLAEPGEFTKRAFLNGRLDLSQAEAVIDLIKARTDRTFDVALKQLDGSYSESIVKIRNKLVDILVNVTVNIDYPDEDIEVLTYEKLKSDLCDVKKSISSLISSAERGRILREGIKVSIIGKPNVGKSSLMNALLQENRAIVTDIPGTTRDTIEEQMSIRGIPVILTDTAGIRNTDDKIEKIGIEKSKEAFNSADLIIYIIDGSRDIDDEDDEMLSYIGERKCIILINKSDIRNVVDDSYIIKHVPNASVIHASVINGEGISELENIFEKMFYGGEVSQSESMTVTNARHADLLKKADSCIDDALSMCEIMQPLEFIEVDINRSYELLGEIIGETVADDILNEVFSRFCLGK